MLNSRWIITIFTTNIRRCENVKFICGHNDSPISTRLSWTFPVLRFFNTWETKFNFRVSECFIHIDSTRRVLKWGLCHEIMRKRAKKYDGSFTSINSLLFSLVLIYRPHQHKTKIWKVEKRFKWWSHISTLKTRRRPTNGGDEARVRQSNFKAINISWELNT